MKMLGVRRGGFVPRAFRKVQFSLSAGVQERCQESQDQGGRRGVGRVSLDSTIRNDREKL